MTGAVWVLVFAWYTAGNGVQILELPYDMNQKPFSSYEECMAFGQEVAQEAMKQGVAENGYDGNCYLVEPSGDDA